MLDLFEILRGHHPATGNHETVLFHLWYIKNCVKFEICFYPLQLTKFRSRVICACSKTSVLPWGCLLSWRWSKGLWPLGMGMLLDNDTGKVVWCFHKNWPGNDLCFPNWRNCWIHFTCLFWLYLLLFSAVSDTVSVGEAADLAELGSEPFKVTPSEPSGLHVEEVSGTFQF